MTTTEPTIVTIPCFTGAPWAANQLEPFAGRKIVTMRLPEGLDDVEAYADFVAAEVAELDSYVLAGDSFGAVIALTVATRRPADLVALVLSGGFAANPLPRWKGIAARASRFAGGPLYRQGTLRTHAFQLASKFDADAEIPLTQNDYRRLFIENTPRRSYTARVTSVINFDIRERLNRINVPTLLLTPQDDTLVGPNAAQDMLAGHTRRPRGDPAQHRPYVPLHPPRPLRAHHRRLHRRRDHRHTAARVVLTPLDKLPV